MVAQATLVCQDLGDMATIQHKVCGLVPLAEASILVRLTVT